MTNRGKRDAEEPDRGELAGNGELGGDYARDTHRGGFGDDYARDGGFSGGGAHDDYARDDQHPAADRAKAPQDPGPRESGIGKASDSD